MFVEKYKKIQAMKTELEVKENKLVEDFYKGFHKRFPLIKDYDFDEILNDYIGIIENIKDVFPDWYVPAAIKARELGLLTDENEKYFDLDLFIEDIEYDERYIELRNSSTILYIDKVKGRGE